MMPRLPERFTRSVRPLLIDRVERDHQQSDSAFRRRRIVVAITLVIGATLLGVSLAVRPGDPIFYVLTFGLAAVWVVGGFASGPLHLGRMSWRNALRRPVWPPILLGVAAAAVFIAGSLIVAQIPSLRAYTENVLAHARYGSLALVALITALNGIAEEIFFRGALFAAIGRQHPVAISTVVYGLATVASGNPMLVFAALILGVVVGLQRRATGGILAPILTHVTWSSIMLFALPPLFSAVG
jgi:membrane protease YdiL (CAAX protease family)